MQPSTQLYLSSTNSTRVKHSQKQPVQQFHAALIDSYPSHWGLASDLLKASGQEFAIQSFPSIEGFFADLSRQTRKVQVAIFCMSGEEMDEKRALEQIKRLRRAIPKIPLVVLSDCEESGRIFQTLAVGVQGYFPTSLNIGVAIAALRLIHAGGLYVPKAAVANAITRTKSLTASFSIRPGRISNGGLTARQREVLNLLRQGRSNRRIAAQLGVRESTVKVHVREIMKRLNASNRTHAVYLAQRAYGV